MLFSRSKEAGMSATDILGTIGVLLLAVCALPQAIKSYKQKHSNGITAYLLWPWFLGELFTLIYLLDQNPIDWILVFNYVANFIFVAIIIYYKYFPKDNKDV